MQNPSARTSTELSRTSSPQTGTSQADDRLTIGKAAKHIGVSIDTLRRWEKRGVVTALRSPGGHRYFLKKDLENLFDQKYTRAAPTKRTPAEKLESEAKLEETKEDLPIEEKVEVSEPVLIESAHSEPIRPPQPAPEATPQSIKPSEAKHIPTQQSMPAQDTPASYPSTTYQSISAVPASGVEQRVKEIVETGKAKKFPWGKALIIGLIIFGVVDIILFIVYLTSSRAPISPIP